jgi:drug/metabolite transporter (DMT)-like permease
LGSFAAIYLIWGSTFLGIKVAVATLPPFFTAGVRFLVSGGILLLASSGVSPRPTARHWRNAAIVGALFFLVNHGLVSSAARFIPSSLASLIAASQVPIIAVLSSVLLPNQPLTRRILIGAALGLGGVLCLFVGQGAQADPSSLWPSLAILGAACSWALGAIFSQRLEFPPHPVLRPAMQMFCGGAMLAVVSLFRGEPWELQSTALSTHSLAALGYLIVFGSIVGFGCYSYLLKHVRTDLIATHVFVNPLVAVALGTWLAGEQLRIAHLVAGFLILASVCVLTLRLRRNNEPTPRPRLSAQAMASHSSSARRIESSCLAETRD